MLSWTDPDMELEDYAFTANRFHLIQLPLPVEKVLLSALRGV